MANGKLIVIDGLDGSGKSTQIDAIEKYFKSLGKDVLKLSFPDYESPSSAPVKMYLRGEISENAGDINAYAASSFYAVDRYISYKKYWEKDYKAGKNIISGRYVSSNCIHQMSKLAPSEWKSFINWLEDFEYRKMEIPRPYAVIYLNITPENSRKLLLERYENDKAKLDIHEQNIKYMKKCYDSALFAAKTLDWNIIEVADKSGNIKPPNAVTDEILKIIKDIER